MNSGSNGFHVLWPTAVEKEECSSGWNFFQMIWRSMILGLVVSKVWSVMTREIEVLRYGMLCTFFSESFANLWEWCLEFYEFLYQIIREMIASWKIEITAMLKFWNFFIVNRSRTVSKTKFAVEISKFWIFLSILCYELFVNWFSIWGL